MDNESKNRMIEVRKFFKLTQGQFAKSLGVKDSAISRIESGINALTEQNIKHICLSFNVDETWMRTGTGTMFGNAIPGERELLEIFRKLSPEMRQANLKISHALLEAQERGDIPAPPAPEQAPENSC
jgi:transcriptional regulator with XRE-family HTH domain